ncbi:MAG: elongation factor P [Rhodospirillaceae bacterium]|nr:elongation factor P [Rhodospirillaceae bacterium]
MKINANSIRGGMVIEHEGKQWSVIKHAIVQPGKGGAFIQVEMRDVASGTKSQARWRTADSVERLEVREIDCQYLYKEGEMYTFMDKSTYDQFGINGELLGERAAFLTDNMDVSVDFIEGKPVSVTLPKSVVLTVVEADPVVKGQTAASSYKPGILENGLKILIPPFIEAGTKIVVNTEDTSYVERAK